MDRFKIGLFLIICIGLIAIGLTVGSLTVEENYAELELKDVHERNGNIYAAFEDGSERELTGEGKDSFPVLNTKINKVLFVRETDQMVEEVAFSTNHTPIMSIDPFTLDEEVVLDEITFTYSNDRKKEMKLPGASHLELSSDERYLFFLVPRWAVSRILIRYDLMNDDVQEVVPANSFTLLESGKYEGNVFVGGSPVIPPQGRKFYYWIYDQEGNEVKEIGDKDDLEKFLGETEIDIDV